MSGEAQLFIDGEDADLVTLRALDRCVARQDECGFAEVGLARQLLHLVIAQTARVGKDGELVALQRPRSKDVQLHEREFALRHGSASAPM